MGGGIHVYAIFKDHFDGLRSLLNFAGMWSFSYTIGLVLAEYVLYLIMASLYILVGILMDKLIGTDHFLKNAKVYFEIIAVFGFPLITFQLVCSFPLAWIMSSNPTNATESGFKYTILPCLALKVWGSYLVYAIMPGVTCTNKEEDWTCDKNTVAYWNPFTALDRSFSKVISKKDWGIDGAALNDVGDY